MSRPPEVGRTFKSSCPSPTLGSPAANVGIKKRIKGNFSVSDAVRLQEFGVHHITGQSGGGVRCAPPMEFNLALTASVGCATSSSVWSTLHCVQGRAGAV
ncbi:LOW QUALITY PROTEIN: hypothetical protein PoB_003531900 [Plakobranchus ocellatus]|uniref:Uncharacterized protein n=1 Tax=Plakobranchus ocellatus TaxID=259542 RepID=A0AAV4AR69_9GAST|nr:LOW QUALITY PROTEIN: hypothetical protein PoB_003531900 [Plakobranchus ocellatus]